MRPKPLFRPKTSPAGNRATEQAGITAQQAGITARHHRTADWHHRTASLPARSRDRVGHLHQMFGRCEDLQLVGDQMERLSEVDPDG